MSRRLPREDGKLQLERAGPDVLPMTFPNNDVIVTDALRRVIEQRSMMGAQFEPVAKARVVDLTWRPWLIRGLLPRWLPKLPPGGEPEDYILTREHEPVLAQRMPELLRLSGTTFGVRGLGDGAVIGRRPLVVKRCVCLNDGPPPDFFGVEGLNAVFVSERACAVLKASAPRCVAFDAVDLVDEPA